MICVQESGAWHLLGIVAPQGGRLSDAAELVGRSVEIDGQVAAAHNNHAIALWRLGRLDAALASLDRTVALEPDDAEAHNNRGNLLRRMGRIDEALASYDRAIALQPGHAETHANRGNALLDLGRCEEALSSYDRAIVLWRDYAEAHGRRGNALLRLGRAEEALSSYDAAIALKPEAPGRYYSRGELLRFEDRTDEAVASLEAAVAVDRLHGAARLAACMAELPILYHSQEEIPLRRQRYLAALARLEAAVEDPAVMQSVAAEIGPPPFYLPYQGENDASAQSIYGRLACRVLAATNPAPPMPARPSSGERIRLGIVSGFFHAHTIFKLFLEGWLTEIDRSRFEVICFHTSRIADDVTTRAAGLADRFVQGLPSRTAWRQAISDAAPHALLYPEVGMDAVVGWLAAQRLAPVQCVSWGHPVTTGLPTMDYFLSSDFMELPDADAHYTERLVRLPRLGLHYTPDEGSPPAIDHASIGIDPTLPVFWSGQTPYKYLPQHDWIFPHIAQAVGPCRFIFVSSVGRTLTEVLRERLGHAFAAAGLDAEQDRVILPGMSHQRFIGVAGLADVILDPPGWSGGKSTLDCLAQNPAIVTWPGPFMRGRHTAAILRQIGCETTIAGSLDEYVAIATRLGLDAAWRMRVRERVAACKHRAFRDRDYIRALESFLVQAVASA